MLTRRFASFTLLLVLAVCLVPGIAYAMTDGNQADSATVLSVAPDNQEITPGSQDLQSQDATDTNGTLSEGSTVLCTLEATNGYEAIFTITPTRTAEYSIYSAGSQEAWAYVVDAEDADVSGRTYGDDDFLLTPRLEAGQTYQLKVESFGQLERSFPIAMYPYGEGKALISNTDLTLDDESGPFKLKVVCDHELSKNTYWSRPDGSCVSWDGTSESKSKSGSLYEWSVLLEARENGNTTVSFADWDNDAVHATCNVACKNITKYYEVFVGGVQVTSKNASNITGSGISGKASYDAATNTLTLDNATLKKASFTYGSKGYPVCVIGYGGNGTLHIKLVGKNQIANVTYPSYNPDDQYGYSASLYYNGIIGISSSGSVSIEGTGSLSIADGKIGKAVGCSRKFTVEKGAALDATVSFSNMSYGVVADGSVTVNGNLKVTNKTCNGVTGICVMTKVLTVGGTGSLVVSTSTADSTTGYGVSLTTGGSAAVKGVLKATASGKDKGFAINGVKGGCKLTVADAGKVTATGNQSALHNIKLSLGKGVVLNAGASSAKAYTTTSSDDLGDVYVAIGKSVAVKVKPTTTKKLAPAKKAITVTWAKQPARNINGYQIQCSMKSSFKSAKKATVKGASKGTSTIKKLKSGKKYYVRVRTFKTVSGKTYYSSWSKAKSATAV